MIIINGVGYNPEADTTLLDYLRNTLHLTGAKDGCSEGACGACSVIINGKLRRACREKLSKLDNAEIITIEGLSEREKKVYSYAFAKAGAVQAIRKSRKRYSSRPVSSKAVLKLLKMIQIQGFPAT